VLSLAFDVLSVAHVLWGLALVHDHLGLFILSDVALHDLAQIGLA